MNNPSKSFDRPTELTDQEEEHLLKGLDALKDVVYKNSVDHGFWTESQNDPMWKLLLIITEVTEAVEWIRNSQANAKSATLPRITNLEEEMADIVIRVCDFSRAFGIRLGAAILEKQDYNRTRAFRHGKTC